MSNMFDKVKNGLREAAYTAAVRAGDTITLNMQRLLQEHQHVDTGELLRSCHHEEEMGNDSITLYIFADAKNQFNNAMYEEFIEHGSGKYREGGRDTPWLYKGSDGLWHWTHGTKPDPFIEPSVELGLEMLGQYVTEEIYDIDKYKGV